MASGIILRKGDVVPPATGSPGCAALPRLISPPETDGQREGWLFLLVHDRRKSGRGEPPAAYLRSGKGYEFRDHRSENLSNCGRPPGATARSSGPRTSTSRDCQESNSCRGTEPKRRQTSLRARQAVQPPLSVVYRPMSKCRSVAARVSLPVLSIARSHFVQPGLGFETGPVLP